MLNWVATEESYCCCYFLDDVFVFVVVGLVVVGLVVVAIVEIKVISAQPTELELDWAVLSLAT